MELKKKPQIHNTNCWSAYLDIAKGLDTNRMYAIWRVPAPWQPVTKKGQGQRMGGGKGAIDHYVTPVKAGRIIIEVGGTCEFEEVRASNISGMIVAKISVANNIL